jgi:hypothetical protein
MQAEAAGAADRISIVAALQNAAAATGSDFHYLLGTAMRESSLRPQARSSTSSASGLFQFVEQTWLGLVKEYGGKYGLGSMAGAIRKDGAGHFHTDNAADHRAILALRNDPRIAALMAGEYAKATRATLETSLGRNVCGGELYAAHFLGADAACKLIRMKEIDPAANAAANFPQAASANKTVFYRADGSARSIGEVYDWALRQPGGAGSPRLAAAVPAEPAGTAQLIGMTDSGGPDLDALLAGVMNWQPSQGFFGQGGDSAATNQPLMLSPAILDLLSSAKPGST